MLTEERFQKILDILEREKSVSAAELVEQLQSSHSTIRRDLSQLEKMGKLTRIHGGAMIKGAQFADQEDRMSTRRDSYRSQKKRIGKKAAAMIEPGDFVYIDAGTTTEAMLEQIDVQDVRFVTNAISHAKILARRGYPVSVIGGSFKEITEAIVGEEAVESVERFNFTKGFFGTNGIDEQGILNTPDGREAGIKRAAMRQCAKCIILADPSKFRRKTAVNFGSLEGRTLITCEPVEREAIKKDCRLVLA